MFSTHPVKYRYFHPPCLLRHIWQLSVSLPPSHLWSIRYTSASARVHHVTNSGNHVPGSSQWMQWRSFSTHVSSECVRACALYMFELQKNSLKRVKIISVIHQWCDLNEWQAAGDEDNDHHHHNDEWTNRQMLIRKVCRLQLLCVCSFTQRLQTLYLKH